MKKVIISGGGTGGHVFPAISIADGIKQKYPEVDILFIGADNRLEMEKVPEAGYEIKGLPIRGLQRKLSLSIFDTFFRLLKSLKLSRKIIKEFKPEIVIGVGGYASAAVMHVAAKRGIPTLIQEQNSYPGITNKMLAKKADAICVAYENMDNFFDKNKIYLTGNPIRNLKDTNVSKKEALDFFGLKEGIKTLFITGGSLGARTINHSLMKNYDKLLEADIQIIWQTGKKYYQEVKDFIDRQEKNEKIMVTKFVNRMDLAYKSADLVISRAGAISISELALLKKAVIFVPSPNVAEDHQTKNAQALVDINAAMMIKDNVAENELVTTAISIIKDDEKLKQMSDNIAKYAKPNSTNDIVKIIEKLTNFK